MVIVCDEERHEECHRACEREFWGHVWRLYLCRIYCDMRWCENQYRGAG